MKLTATLLTSLLVSLGGAGFASAVKHYIQNHVEAVALAPLTDISTFPTETPTPTVTPTPSPKPTVKPAISVRASLDDESDD